MLLNYSNAAREAGVSVKTIREYYQILEDTLIGRQLLPWKKSKKRRLIETAKFFFFDIGIIAGLLGYKSLTPGTSEYVRAFEHFIIQECWAYRHYSKKDFPMTFWRTASGTEVDLILGDAEIAIEIKASPFYPGILFVQCSGMVKSYEIMRTEGDIPGEMVPYPASKRLLDIGLKRIPFSTLCGLLSRLPAP